MYSPLHETSRHKSSCCVVVMMRSATERERERERRERERERERRDDYSNVVGILSKVLDGVQSEIVIIFRKISESIISVEYTIKLLKRQKGDRIGEAD